MLQSARRYGRGQWEPSADRTRSLCYSLRDGTAVVSERAEQLWHEAGRQYLAENENENRQLINYPLPPPDGYPAQREWPRQGYTELWLRS